MFYEENEIPDDVNQLKNNDSTPCDLGCGGEMSWCEFCKVWTNTCCIPYGTCQCS
jgi:hypothetical protein